MCMYHYITHLFEKEIEDHAKACNRKKRKYATREEKKD